MTELYLVGTSVASEIARALATIPDFRLTAEACTFLTKQEWAVAPELASRMAHIACLRPIVRKYGMTPLLRLFLGQVVSLEQLGEAVGVVRACPYYTLTRAGVDLVAQRCIDHERLDWAILIGWRATASMRRHILEAASNQHPSLSAIYQIANPLIDPSQSGVSRREALRGLLAEFGDDWRGIAFLPQTKSLHEDSEFYWSTIWLPRGYSWAHDLGMALQLVRATQKADLLSLVSNPHDGGHRWLAKKIKSALHKASLSMLPAYNLGWDPNEIHHVLDMFLQAPHIEAFLWPHLQIVFSEHEKPGHSPQRAKAKFRRQVGGRLSGIPTCLPAFGWQQRKLWDR